MVIAVGDRLPKARFTIMTASGPAPKSTDEIFGGKLSALFAVPGAFTPTCHRNHLPGFLENADALKAKGIDQIVCTSTNDIFVLTAWAAASGAADKIVFISDGNGDFAKAIGLDNDGTPNNMGIRSKRYAMLVEDGVVKILNIEDGPGKADISSAVSLLAGL
ncbi:MULTISPECIES: peroxiredoxin [Rhodomicrobium]|uniref:peroxiredoxin n=1 Tax=Rhodomicrobium TaxID=1068 RepID=UPI000B4B6296|nr:MULTISPECIES: peroxiredoxin [Rhodomicrobium]